jgi:hypothetical protein
LLDLSDVLELAGDQAGASAALKESTLFYELDMVRPHRSIVP